MDGGAGHGGGRGLEGVCGGGAGDSGRVVDVQLHVLGCSADVQPEWVSIRVTVAGGVYLGDPRGGPIRYRALVGEQSAHVSVREATGTDEECRAAATLVETRPRLAGGGNEPRLEAVVRVKWRLLREEVVALPAGAILAVRRYLLERILAEGEEVLLVHLHPTAPG